MKKELFIAVLIGLSLGLIITYGIYNARLALLRPKSADASPSPTAASSPSLSKLVLHSPEDESVVTVSEVTIAGTTSPRTIVVVILNETETITTADDSGSFSVVGTLKEGGNGIAVYQYDEDGAETVVERTVVYLTEDLAAEKTASASATPSASPKPTASTKASTKPSPSASPRVN